MRVALIAQDDTASTCLNTLAAQGCTVLGLASGDVPCAGFARRCVELGFSFVSTQDPTVDALVLSNFKPEILVRFPDSAPLPSEVVAALPEGAKRYGLRVGEAAPGAPWPEFAPIWACREVSRVSIVQLDQEAEVGSLNVPVTGLDTAISLRTKHATAAAQLLGGLLAGGDLPHAKADDASALAQEVPPAISLKWDEATVERYIRAHLFPPRDAAVIEHPASGDKYFIESMEQYRQFLRKVDSDAGVETAAGPGNGLKLYAADTHWYSNIGGSIVRMGDSQVHEPTKTTDKKRKAVIPGAALGARKKLRMNEPIIGTNAQRYCADALASSWIGVEGPFVKQLERHLAQICGCSTACAVQSGTAALYGAMKALGVSHPSHHVLVPAFTCAACADAVVHAGGRPIPIDCDLDSYGLCAEAVRKALDSDKDIQGVVVAPCYGVPARDFAAIYALCKERGLWICEDACESYGALQAMPSEDKEGGKVPVGSLATLSVVSIRSEKMIGVGEGGAILGNDPTLVARAKWWCSRAPSRGVGLWRVYEHDAVGQNFRLPEMLAAIGVASAEMLPLMIERKRVIHGWYSSCISKNPALAGVRMQKATQDDEPVWWLNAALLPEGLPSEEVGMQIMKSYPDIEIRPGFFPLNQMAIFQSEWNYPCPHAESLYRRLVCLPSSSELKEEDVERICGALAEAMADVGRSVAAASVSASA